MNPIPINDATAPLTCTAGSEEIPVRVTGSHRGSPSRGRASSPLLPTNDARPVGPVATLLAARHDLDRAE